MYNSLIRKDFKRATGPFTVNHLYYKDGTTRIIMANSCIKYGMTKNDDRPRITFCTVYRGIERYIGYSNIPTKEMRIEIHTPSGYKSVDRLDHKMVSLLNLNPRKTWFGIYSNGSYICDDKDRKVSDLIGFRRVPRKWVPELNRMLVKED
jgi:hypothetical protein